jgi:hypothetical protein
MPEQTTLFNVQRHDDHVSIEPNVPDEPEPVPVERYDGTEPVHPETAARMLDALTGLRKRYYELLRRITIHGYRTQSGVVIHSLTDREAAAALGCERTTICGRRNELMGGSGGEAFEAHPVVKRAGDRRSCHVRPGGPDVYAYDVRLDLYSFDHDTIQTQNR